MGANVKAIRTRIRSVESTMHITKAMELVAASKIRRATQRMDQSRFFFRVMSEAFSDMAEGALHSVYARARDEHLRCYVVIAGDRGLAGGYNNNVFKTVALDSGVAQMKTASSDQFVQLSEPVMTEQYGIGFRKGNTALRDAVQKTLKEMVADGSAARISARYFNGRNVLILKP